VTTASALLRYGPEHMTLLVNGLERWLSQNRFASVAELRGYRDGTHVDNAGSFLRAEYLRALSDYALPNSREARDWLARQGAASGR